MPWPFRHLSFDVALVGWLGRAGFLRDSALSVVREGAGMGHLEGSEEIE